MEHGDDFGAFGTLMSGQRDPAVRDWRRRPPYRGYLPRPDRPPRATWRWAPTVRQVRRRLAGTAGRTLRWLGLSPDPEDW